MARRPYAPRGASLKEVLAFHSEAYVPGRCQLWLSAKNFGYGVVKWRGRRFRVHRAVWEVERGPIPEGVDVLHTCDNPSCCNIDHLFLGTDADNMADKVTKGRQAHTSGEINGMSKLTEDEVLEIRAIPRDVPQRIVGSMYGISGSAVAYIRSRKRWAHLR